MSGFVPGARRLVVKVGSSSITAPAGGIDPAPLTALVDALAAHRAAGREVILVSSGAIAAGLGPMGIPARPRDLPTQQAAASVGQSLLMAAYAQILARHGITPAQVLLSADDLARRTHYRNAQQAIERLLALGMFPIVNENDTVATQEIRFGDNDRLAALVAHLSHADALVLLSDVDALYTAPPGEPGAERIDLVGAPSDLDEVRVGGVGSGVGTGGMATKVHAASIAADSGIPAVVTSLSNIGRVLSGDDVGTVFTVTHRRRSTRLLWLAHLAEPEGALRVDAGAAEALIRRGKSLLAVGVTRLEGEFDAGDPVDIQAPDGRPIARGLVRYSSAELPAMLGRSTDEIGDRLGGSYAREVVHRNDLIVIDQHMKAQPV